MELYFCLLQVKDMERMLVGLAFMVAIGLHRVKAKKQHIWRIFQ